MTQNQNYGGTALRNEMKSNKQTTTNACVCVCVCVIDPWTIQGLGHWPQHTHKSKICVQLSLPQEKVIDTWLPQG